MTIADRRKAERDLLCHYCEELVKHGVHISYDKAWDDYRRWVVWGLVAWHHWKDSAEPRMILRHINSSRPVFSPPLRPDPRAIEQIDDL
jgi:transposase